MALSESKYTIATPFRRVLIIAGGTSYGIQPCWNSATCHKIGTISRCSPLEKHAFLSAELYQARPMVLLSSCPDCNIAYYCSDRCQAVHYTEHQKYCAKTKKRSPPLYEGGKFVNGVMDLLQHPTSCSPVHSHPTTGTTIRERCFAFVYAVGGGACCRCQKRNGDMKFRIRHIKTPGPGRQITAGVWFFCGTDCHLAITQETTWTNKTPFTVLIEFTNPGSRSAVLGMTVSGAGGVYRDVVAERGFSVDCV